MTRWFLRFSTIFLVLFGTWPASASADVALAAPSTTIPVVTTAPSLDPAVPAVGWPDASFTLGWDVVHARAAEEPAAVRLVADAKFLYVRFDVTQAGGVIATQHGNDLVTGGNTNNAIAWSVDDAVWVDLWPTGPSGFRYQFEANPLGAHNEASSENSAFAPSWESHGAVRADGYTVTMAIPLGVIHGAHSGTWRVQLLRYVRSTGAVDVWSYAVTQTQPDDASRAGSLDFTVVPHATTPPPRAALYGLGDIAAPSAGGSTARVGTDLSIPVSPTSAFFAALHPDYSNVELDQQTISPSVYQRQYSEVRPFFTQAASFYNNFNCDSCVYHSNLYTPAIPTFAQGYAFEGTRGAYSFAAFDAIGAGRTDAASALNYLSPDTHWGASFQHVTADVPGIADASNQVGIKWSDRSRFGAYLNVGNETGTLVPDPGRAMTYDAGGGYGSPRFGFYAAVRSIGDEYDPVDGYVAHAGIAGYSLYSARIWSFGPNNRLASVGLSGSLDRYQGPIYGQSQSDNQIVVDLLTKSAWDLQLYSGSDYWRFGDALVPISQNGGFQLTYHSGLQTNNPGNFPNHGSSATPTLISYNTGRYGPGRLDTWLRTSTIRVGERGTLSLTLDDTAQYVKIGQGNVQWFDGLAYAYQIDRESSFAIGLRRVIGYAPIPNGGGNCAGVCSNVSIAYHTRFRHIELYAAYGNPNTLSTVPQAIVKLIFYAGGSKGT
jgi:hypothetical protein